MRVNSSFYLIIPRNCNTDVKRSGAAKIEYGGSTLKGKFGQYLVSNRLICHACGKTFWKVNNFSILLKFYYYSIFKNALKRISRFVWELAGAKLSAIFGKHFFKEVFLVMVELSYS